jgi:hypothetical protein
MWLVGILGVGARYGIVRFTTGDISNPGLRYAVVTPEGATVAVTGGTTSILSSTTVDTLVGFERDGDGRVWVTLRHTGAILERRVAGLDALPR